jgi:hypothetical protein
MWVKQRCLWLLDAGRVTWMVCGDCTIQVGPESARLGPGARRDASLAVAYQPYVSRPGVELLNRDFVPGESEKVSAPDPGWSQPGTSVAPIDCRSMGLVLWR